MARNVRQSDVPDTGANLLEAISFSIDTFAPGDIREGNAQQAALRDQHAFWTPGASDYRSAPAVPVVLWFALIMGALSWSPSATSSCSRIAGAAADDGDSGRPDRDTLLRRLPVRHTVFRFGDDFVVTVGGDLTSGYPRLITMPMKGVHMIRNALLVLGSEREHDRGGTSGGIPTRRSRNNRRRRRPRPLAPMPAATATPSPDPAMLARAKIEFAQLQSGKIDRTTLTTEMSMAVRR